MFSRDHVLALMRERVHHPAAMRELLQILKIPRDEHTTFKRPPWKFEAGTMNIAQEIGLLAAIEYLQELGMDAVRAHEQELTAYAMARLTEIGAKVFGPTDVELRGAAVSFWYFCQV